MEVVWLTLIFIVWATIGFISSRLKRLHTSGRYYWWRSVFYGPGGERKAGVMRTANRKYYIAVIYERDSFRTLGRPMFRKNNVKGVIEDHFQSEYPTT